MHESENPILIYEGSGNTVEVRLDAKKHLKNVFTDAELVREAVVAKNATTASDGKNYQVEYFNLDVIISVGYRVNAGPSPHQQPTSHSCKLS